MLVDMEQQIIQAWAHSRLLYDRTASQLLELIDNQPSRPKTISFGAFLQHKLVGRAFFANSKNYRVAVRLLSGRSRYSLVPEGVWHPGL